MGYPRSCQDPERNLHRRVRRRIDIGGMQRAAGTAVYRDRPNVSETYVDLREADAQLHLRPGRLADQQPSEGPTQSRSEVGRDGGGCI